ncbi:MAG: MGMT family protein, partial [Candidatus Thiodiazotropha sp. (ex Notomyrtea botanica)]|nr:MGMT family protein [Candidatus Thiodiazotropha sp. (ex Notomyrtea botanica)]
MHEDKLAGVEYLDAFRESFVREMPGLNPVLQSIRDYLADAKNAFDLDLHLDGTPFQHRVWQALQAIPAGETLTYGALAEYIGSGAREVGNACRA